MYKITNTDRTLRLTCKNNVQVGPSEESYNTEKPVASFKFRQRGTGPQLGENVDEIKCAAQKDEIKQRMKTAI